MVNANGSACPAPPPYYSYPPGATTGYNFNYGSAPPPAAVHSEYTNTYVQDAREGCYNMVYVPPNPSTGFNGHFSLVTPPQQHQESPTSTEATVTSGGMHDSWQATAWVTQTSSSNANQGIMDNQQHYSGFASPTEAEIALSGSGMYHARVQLGTLNRASTEYFLF